MGDFEIDMPDWDTQESFRDTIVKKFKELEDEKIMKAQTHSPNRQNFRDLGGFRVFKVNNGYVIQVGSHEGYAPSDAYICKEASEIGDLITAHIVSATLEK